MVTSVAILALNNHWESNYQGFNQNFSFQHRYNIVYPLKDSWSFYHTGDFVQNQNNRFNRLSRSSDYNWNIHKEDQKLGYLFHLDYTKDSDSALQDIGEYSVSQTMRKAGVKLFLNPSDSLFINTGVTYISSGAENSYLQNHSIQSDGYQSFSDVNYIHEFVGGLLSLKGNLGLLDLDYDHHLNYGSEARLNLHKINLDSEIMFNRNIKKIYLLDDRIDTHSRTNYSSSIAYRTVLSEGMTLRLGDTFKIRDNRFQHNYTSNFLETDNTIYLDSNYHIWLFRIFNDISYRDYSRSFTDDTNSRKQRNTNYLSGISYSFTPRDSLVVSRQLSLTSTDYATGSNILDNDQLSDQMQLSLYWHFRDGIFVTNRFNYTRREEVYLKAQMSGNNKVSKSYNLLPAVNIVFKDHIQFLQEYHLRADYDDFVWSDFARDRMYRKFTASYTLNTSFLSELITFTDNSLSQDYYGDQGLNLSVNYTYDTNDSGTRYDDVYEINTVNEYHIYQIDLRKFYPRIVLRLRPRYIYAKDSNEFNHIFQCSYTFPNKSSYASLTVNPSGRSWDDAIWRISFDLIVGF